MSIQRLVLSSKGLDTGRDNSVGREISDHAFTPGSIYFKPGNKDSPK